MRDAGWVCRAAGTWFARRARSASPTPETASARSAGSAGTCPSYRWAAASPSCTTSPPTTARRRLRVARAWPRGVLPPQARRTARVAAAAACRSHRASRQATAFPFGSGPRSCCTGGRGAWRLWATRPRGAPSRCGWMRRWGTSPRGRGWRSPSWACRSRISSAWRRTRFPSLPRWPMRSPGQPPTRWCNSKPSSCSRLRWCTALRARRACRAPPSPKTNSDGKMAAVERAWSAGYSLRHRLCYRRLRIRHPLPRRLLRLCRPLLASSPGRSSRRRPPQWTRRWWRGSRSCSAWRRRYRRTARQSSSAAQTRCARSTARGPSSSRPRSPSM
mmetsp:Transcript_49140/g.159726  ORF Transcript_49140/g.159726 Transcript_49140/m.159726 type:complete len:331 (-) Transcript_49140:3552-4544(-)